MVPGVHVPLHTPFKQTLLVHAGFVCQLPLLSQVSGVDVLAQALVPGVQLPLQTPAVQMYWQGVPGVH
jgi:hypothetical protein